MEFKLGRVLKVVALVVVGFFLLVAIVGTLGERNRQSQPSPAPPQPLRQVATNVQPDANPAREAAIDEAVAEIEKNWPKTLDAAIKLFRPDMDDTVDKTSNGTLMLTAWCADHLTWQEFKRPVVGTRSPAKVRKDVEDSRGRKICTPRGRIIEIKKQRVGELPPFFLGLLRINGDGELIHFYAVRSTGDLVERSSAQFCGVVTGVFDYHNSMGGIGHAIELVGMFDLPENH